MIWSKLQNIINNNQSFILSSHVNPDGDCICSELILYWYLSSIGKSVVIYNYDPVPNKFRFLHNSGIISNVQPQIKFDVFIILDASNPLRLGWDNYNTIAPIIINIDHHRDNTHIGHFNIVDVNAAATCQILYRFLEECNISYPSHIAETIYAGILTDTGGFQFSNTDSNILRICANLSDKGASCSEIYRNIYSSYSAAGMLLRAKIWSSLTFYFDNKLSSMEISETELNESKANYGDIEGMSDLALTGLDVEVGIFIKHTDTHTHFSLRSKGKVDVGKVAQTIPGGGGHTCAAGCTIESPVEKAKPEMLKIIKEWLV